MNNGFVRIAAVSVLIACRSSALADEPAFKPPAITVPEGFTVEVAAAPPLVKHPLMAGFDDRGRLYIAESAGKNLSAEELIKQKPNFVRRIEDTDGDGVFDKSTIFADNMVMPQGALWYRGAVYVASPPSIWRLEDTDDDGVADKREEIVKTFGFTGNAADIHGCFLGPEGRIYWCDGRHGHDFGDGRKGLAARIFSCRPDGSDVQVHCGGGMDNPVEIDFTPEGEMIGTVNILQNPRGDCLMHWVYGGVYPREDQEQCIAEFKRTGDLLPPTKNLGHVAVSGLTRYRSEVFGKEYRDNFFVTLFNTHAVIRSELRRDGSTFATTEHEFLKCDSPDFHPTDVLEDADGSLLVIDTGGWFRIGCPTSQIAKPEIPGAIYRVRRKGAEKVEDPWGLKIDWDHLSGDEVVSCLNDPRPAVQEKVIEVVSRMDIDDGPFCAQLEKDTTTNRFRINATWAIARLAQSNPYITMILLHRAAHSDITHIPAARALGQPAGTVHIAPLTTQMEQEDLAVRREAATSLGRICRTRSIEIGKRDREDAITALVRGLTKSPPDRILEHAVIYALIEIADREQTIPLLSHSNPEVRRAGLIALDQMEGGDLTRELVAPLLDTDDAALQKTALEVITRHPGWGDEITGLLTEWLGERQPLGERAAVVRGALVAFAGDEKIQALIAETLADEAGTVELRALMVETIARSRLNPVPEAWTDSIESILQAPNKNMARVMRQAIIAAAEIDAQRFRDSLASLAENETVPTSIRVAAVAALPGEPVNDGTFDMLRRLLDAAPMSRMAAARALAGAKLKAKQIRALAENDVAAAGPVELPLLLGVFEQPLPQNEATPIGAALEFGLAKSPGLKSLTADRVRKVFSAYSETPSGGVLVLLKELESTESDQREAVELHQRLIAIGEPDAARGKEIFLSKKTACATCHRIGDDGGRIGPELTKIGAIRTNRDLLESIVAPSASLARGFESFTVNTQAGLSHTGLIAREAQDAVYLRTADRAEIRIARDDIAELAPARLSIMPQGLARTMTADELRDLIAFLATCR